GGRSGQDRAGHGQQCPPHATCAAPAVGENFLHSPTPMYMCRLLAPRPLRPSRPRRPQAAACAGRWPPQACRKRGTPFGEIAMSGNFWFFSQLRGERRTADPAELLFSRQQNGAGRGRSGLYVPAGWLEGLSRMGLASGGSGRPVLGGAGTGDRRGRTATLFGL